jgi:HAD superfamily hydrolase (TIGR01509 family)
LRSLRLEGVVFDLDGLLVDSTAVWEAGFQRGAAVAGLRLTRAQRKALEGSSAESAGQAIATWASCEEQTAAITTAVEAALRDGALVAPPSLLPGAAGLLNALNGRLPLAIASNGPPSVVAAMLANAGLAGVFRHVVTAAEAAAPKPDPSVYRIACERLGLNPVDCAAVEDSAVGAESSTRAGLTTFLVGPQALTARRVLPRRLARYVRTAPSLADPRLGHWLLGEPGPAQDRGLPAAATGRAKT